VIGKEHTPVKKFGDAGSWTLNPSGKDLYDEKGTLQKSFFYHSVKALPVFCLEKMNTVFQNVIHMFQKNPNDVEYAVLEAVSLIGSLYKLSFILSLHWYHSTRCCRRDPSGKHVSQMLASFERVNRDG
jgi:hypothetical protein